MENKENRVTTQDKLSVKQRDHHPQQLANLNDSSDLSYVECAENVSQLDCSSIAWSSDSSVEFNYKVRNSLLKPLSDSNRNSGEEHEVTFVDPEANTTFGSQVEYSDACSDPLKIENVSQFGINEGQVEMDESQSNHFEDKQVLSLSSRILPVEILTIFENESSLRLSEIDSEQQKTKPFDSGKNNSETLSVLDSASMDKTHGTKKLIYYANSEELRRKDKPADLQIESVQPFQTSDISEYKKVFEISNHLNNALEVNEDKETAECVCNMEASEIEMKIAIKTFEESEETFNIDQSVSGCVELLQSTASMQSNKITDAIESQSNNVELVNDSVEPSQTFDASGRQKVVEMDNGEFLKESFEPTKTFCEIITSVSETVEFEESHSAAFISVKELLESPRSACVSKETVENSSEDPLGYVEPVNEFTDEVRSGRVESGESQNISISACDKALASTVRVNQMFETNELISESTNELIAESDEILNKLNKAIEANAGQFVHVEPPEAFVCDFGCEKVAEAFNELNKTSKTTKDESNKIVEMKELVEPPQNVVETSDQPNDKPLEQVQNVDISGCENIVKSSVELNKTFETTEEMPDCVKSIKGSVEQIQTECEKIGQPLSSLNKTFEAHEIHCDPVTSDCKKYIETSQLNKTVEVNDNQSDHKESIQEPIELLPDVFSTLECEKTMPISGSLNQIVETNHVRGDFVTIDQSNKTVEVNGIHSEHIESIIAVSSCNKVDETSDRLNKTIETSKDVLQESLNKSLEDVATSRCETANEISEPLNKIFESNENHCDLIESPQTVALSDCEKIVDDHTESIEQSPVFDTPYCGKEGATSDRLMIEVNEDVPKELVEPIQDVTTLSCEKAIYKSVPLNKTIEAFDNQLDQEESVEQPQDIAVLGCKRLDENSDCLNKTIEINKDTSFKPLKNALGCETTIETSEPLSRTGGTIEINCDLAESPQTVTALPECKEIVETSRLNKTFEANCNQPDHTESVEQSPIVDICRKVDEATESLRRSIDINMLKESVAAVGCEKAIQISNHMESAKKLIEPPLVFSVSGCNEVGEISDLSGNISSENQSIEPIQTPGVLQNEKVVRVEAHCKETLEDYVESEKAVAALARSLNQTIDVEESAIAEDDELSDTSSNNLNVTVKGTPEKENIAKEESEHQSERLVAELEVALKTESTEFNVSDDIDGEKASENDEQQSKYKRIECRRNIRALRNKTQVITDPLLLKIEPTNEAVLVKDSYEQKRDELKIMADRLQQELDSIHKDNLQTDQLILSHALDRQAKRNIIKKYEQVSQDYKNQMSKQHTDLRNARKHLENFTRHFTSAEMAFSDVFQKYERAKIVINGFRKNEANLTKSIQDAEFQLAQLDANCKAMEDQYKQNIKKAQDQVNQEKEMQKQNIAKLQAMVKRLEIKASSLETALKQKSEECRAIAALCDDITGRNPV